MSSQLISAFPYYGGKARMCPLISSRLDYEHTEVFIEPYGGGARVLLNKPRHDVEIYNDFSPALTAFFEVMTDRDSTEELIEMLLQNRPSRELFQEQQIKRMCYEDRLNADLNAMAASTAWNIYKREGIREFKELKKAIREEEYDRIIQCLDSVLRDKKCKEHMEPLEEEQLKGFLKVCKDYWKLVSVNVGQVRKRAEKDFDNAWTMDLKMAIPQAEEKTKTRIRKLYEKARKDCVKSAVQEEINSFTDDIMTSNAGGQSIPDIEMAFAIFHLYQTSRDGKGTEWSVSAGDNIKAYERAVFNLRKVSERMEGVIIENCDAGMLIQNYMNERSVMMYLDPSYLKPGDETINLGAVYKRSYSYKEHEELLRLITDSYTCAKIMISNYDVELYNTYLYEWGKTYYETSTGVGGKKNNKRVEVLWQNY